MKKPTNKNLAVYIGKGVTYISNLRNSKKTEDKRLYKIIRESFIKAHKGQECKK